MKILTYKIVNGKKMFLIEDNDSQGRVFAQGGKPIKKENISYYNPYYVDIKGINSSDNVSTKLIPSKKITPQELKQIKESPTNVGNITLKEKQEKAQRLKEAEEAYQKRKSGAPVTPELLAQETQAIGDKISLQNIPGVGQYIPDILDVTGGIGSMASGLGSIPLNLNRGNYGQALLSVASPLATGALAGVSANTTGEFINNIVNPLAGTGDLMNNLGNKYLPNAYKLNPWAFKPNEANWYRQVGKDAIDDAFQTGIVRGNRENVTQEGFEKFLQSEPGDPVTAPYFSKGNTYFPNLKDKNYLIETALPDENFQKSYMWSFEKGTGPNEMGAAVLRPNPQIRGLDNFNIYKKDWLRGYKEVPKPQQTFKSEINWGKWNKEIPENTQLLEEYNTIEQTSKANGSWMKNPDGSPFQGTPEQFVQQNSQNFKKAFGNSKLLNDDGSPMKVYHGSAKKFDVFDESKFQLGDSGYSGKGIYTTPSKIKADSYALSSGSFHSGEKIPTTYELYGRANNPIRSSELPEGYDLFDFYREKNWQGDVPIQKQLKDYDAAIANKRGMIDRIYPDKDAAEIVFPTNKQVKSAIGNNGMFDMTNPNIYKSIVGALATGTLGKQAVEKQEFGGKIKVLDTKIENGKKYFLINK